MSLSPVQATPPPPVSEQEDPEGVAVGKLKPQTKSFSYSSSSSGLYIPELTVICKLSTSTDTEELRSIEGQNGGKHMFGTKVCLSVVTIPNYEVKSLDAFISRTPNSYIISFSY